MLLGGDEADMHMYAYIIDIRPSPNMPVRYKSFVKVLCQDLLEVVRSNKVPVMDRWKTMATIVHKLFEIVGKEDEKQMTGDCNIEEASWTQYLIIESIEGSTNGLRKGNELYPMDRCREELKQLVASREMLEIEGSAEKKAKQERRARQAERILMGGAIKTKK